MGGVFSRNSSRIGASEILPNESCKRQRLSSSFSEETKRLIPSLPDEISLQILARLPRIYYLYVKLVSRSWKAAVMSRELFTLRKELGTTEEWLYLLTKEDDGRLSWLALDPSSGRWQRLPPLPGVAFQDESRKVLPALQMWNAVGSSIKIADVLRGWFRRKDAPDGMSLCGCAIGAVDGCLYVLGGFSGALALRLVWRYDPLMNSWSEVSPMSIGRAYCKTGVINNKLYVVGGVTRGRAGLTPLQSAEVFDPHTGLWSQIPSMPFSKAQDIPTAFLADLLKPIATGMTAYRGKLYVPQSLYFWPFLVDIGGEIYDPDENSWDEIPVGMGEGWPIRQAGTKLSVTVEGELYALDHSGALESPRIKVYDFQDDTWKVVVGDVPILEFMDSGSPYLLAGLQKRLHVLTKDANHNIVVLQANVQKHLSSLSSASSFSLHDSLDECAESTVESYTDPWKVIATRCARSTELVSCQTLEI